MSVGPPTSTTLYVTAGAGCGSARARTARYVVAARMEAEAKRIAIRSPQLVRGRTVCMV